METSWGDMPAGSVEAYSHPLILSPEQAGNSLQLYSPLGSTESPPAGHNIFLQLKQSGLMTFK